MEDYTLKQNPLKNKKGLSIKAVTKACLIHSNYKKALVTIIILVS